MKHVLVVQLARFGDLLQSKRLILSLHANSDTCVHLCVDTSLVAMASFLYPFAIVHGLSAHASGGCGADALARVFFEGKQTFAALASIQFDDVYTLNSSPLTYAIARLFPPETVHGYFVANGQNNRSTWCRMAKTLTARRAVSPLNLVDYWAHFHDTPVSPGSVNPVARRAGSGVLGVALAGRDSRRSLPVEVLARCMHAIFRGQDGPSFLLLGSKAERPLARKLAGHLPGAVLGRVKDLTGHTDLIDLPGVLEGCDGLLTPDTGIMHLAAHLGVPVQAFFLSSAWCFETGPYGLGHKVWQAVTPCTPCIETQTCHKSVQCLDGFSHKSFLLYLSGKYTADWPSTLCGYVSLFDASGSTYRLLDGSDPYQDERIARHHCIAEYMKRPIGQVPGHIAEDIYTEQDWMLPSHH